MKILCDSKKQINRRPVTASQKSVNSAEATEYEDDDMYTSEDWMEDLQGMAYRYGYDLDYSFDANDREVPYRPIMTFKAREELMPEIKARVVISEYDQSLLVIAADIVNFPNLMDADMDYHDSASHYISKWAQAGELVDRMYSEKFNWQ